jgi:hypothetical protein
MKRGAACLLFLIGLISTANAGQVYGTIYQNNQPVPNAQVALSCPGGQAAGATDNGGVYRLFGRGTGTCILVLNLQGFQASGSLYSYDRPTAYDFDLVRQGDGSWRLSLRKR